MVVERAQRRPDGHRRDLARQRLGLTDLRFGIAAEDGVWHFTAAARRRDARRRLGGGRPRAPRRARPGPPPRRRSKASLELRVDNLGTWGPWLPPGWRLGGALHASASFGGRFGAPQYTGHVEGARPQRCATSSKASTSPTAASRSRLQGTSAHIETLHRQGRRRHAALEGDAAFDDVADGAAAPRARPLRAARRASIGASSPAAPRRCASTRRRSRSTATSRSTKASSTSPAPMRRRSAATSRSCAGRRRAGAAAAALAQAQAAGAPSSRHAARARSALDLRVDMGEKLRVRGRGLDAGLRGELHLTSPERPARRRRHAARGRRHVPGLRPEARHRPRRAHLRGPVENPRLDIEATRPNLDVRVGVAVTGTALNPRIRLFSEPELSDIDKLSWLVLGRASETTGGADTALLQHAALALLSGEGPGRDRPADQGDRPRRDLGAADARAPPRTRSSASASRSRSAGTSATSAASNAPPARWQLIYRVAQRVTVRAAGRRRQRGRRDLDLALEIGASLGRDVPVGLGDVVLHEGLDRRRGIDARRIEIELPLVARRASAPAKLAR